MPSDYWLIIIIAAIIFFTISFISLYTEKKKRQRKLNLKKIIKYLGDYSNIDNLKYENNQLVMDIKNKQLISIKKIKENGASVVVIQSKKISLLFDQDISEKVEVLNI